MIGLFFLDGYFHTSSSSSSFAKLIPHLMFCRQQEWAASAQLHNRSGITTLEKLLARQRQDYEN
jgi:hypothetical protein